MAVSPSPDPAVPGPSTARLPLRLLRRLCSAGEMRHMDQQAIEGLGLPGRLLMENAAHQVAARLQELLRSSAAPRQAPVVVCCGTGNNGGDGYAAARLLQNAGVRCLVVRSAAPLSADAVANAQAWEHFGRVLDLGMQRQAALVALESAPALVDAVFGTGLSRPVTGTAADLIAAMNAASAGIKLAVDLPSGLHSDTGAVLGCAVQATHTVCIQAAKIGCHQQPGSSLSGQVSVAPVSIPLRWPAAVPPTYLLTERFAAALLPPRPAASHKNTFGHVLAVCGSAGMGGAAQLAGLSALKVGAGLVTLAVPAELRDRFLAGAPELMTLAPGGGHVEHFELAHLAFLREHAAAWLPGAGNAPAAGSALVLGCGLGRDGETGQFVNALLREAPGPLVVDADGLCALRPEELTGRAVPAVLTPHPGELARLSGLSAAELSQDRVGHARRLAALWGVVLVLKGSGTVVAAPEGPAFINPTGDAGLASAGTGDVLAGIIGGLLAQGLQPLPAALLGVYLHGLARDCSRPALTAGYFSASDLVRGINAALQQLGSI